MTDVSTAPAVSFSEILVATDFSDASDSALQYAKALASHSGGELLLVHVADPAHGGAADPGHVDHEMHTLRAASDRLRNEGYRAKDLCAFGGVASEVIRIAEQQGATVIVAGTHSRKGLNRLLFGSDAENILRAAHIPVLLIGPEVVPGVPGSLAFHHVLCAVLLSRHGAEVARLARRFAEDEGARFELRSFPFHDTTEEAEGYAGFRDRLEELPHPGSPVVFEPIPMTEPTAACMTELARAEKVDLIILDHRGGLLGPRLGGSLLSELVANVPCPVLAVPINR